MKDYQEGDVLFLLKKKHDLNIVGKVIQELKRFPGPKGTPGKGDVGIHSKGKIDFLTRYCGYKHMFVNTFDK